MYRIQNHKICARRTVEFLKTQLLMCSYMQNTHGWMSLWIAEVDISEHILQCADLFLLLIVLRIIVPSRSYLASAHI